MTTSGHLEILSVVKQGKRSVWTRIGTAFPTTDGKGFRLKLDYVPLDPSAASVVMYPPKATEEEGR